jgi:cytochrome c oxidase assembly factor CtaG
MGTLTHPFVALPLWLVTYFVWHVPGIYDSALEHPNTLLHIEHAMYFATGFLMWWPVFHATPRRLPSATRALYLFAAFMLASPIGLLIALVPEPVYAFYENAPRVTRLSALEDQQLAGITMALEQATLFFALFTVAFLDFLRSES